MAQRMSEIPGVVGAHLSEGKRGRFTVLLYDQTDWNPSTDSEIRLGDPIPDKPWIACNYSRIRSEGRGRNKLETDSTALVFITHHALSRTAQRFGLRTADDMIEALQIIWNAAATIMNEKGYEEVFNPPLEGWRAP